MIPLRYFAMFLLFPTWVFAQSGWIAQDLAKLQSVGEAQISPDGSHIIYTVVHNDRPGTPYSEAWVMDVASGKSIKLGEANGARWSPDGKRIAYFGNTGGKSGLVIAKADATSPEFIAASRAGEIFSTRRS